MYHAGMKPMVRGGAVGTVSVGGSRLGVLRTDGVAAVVRRVRGSSVRRHQVDGLVG